MRCGKKPHNAILFVKKKKKKQRALLGTCELVANRGRKNVRNKTQNRKSSRDPDSLGGVVHERLGRHQQVQRRKGWTRVAGEVEHGSQASRCFSFWGFG